jgi:2-phosphosulfolactate phosphatase
MQPRSIEVLLSPAEFEALAKRDLSRVTCVVFDVLRATTSMLVALANGARAIVPVSDIAEALAFRQEHPDCLLAGERYGLRIRTHQTGSIDFDLGNSPREFTADRVRDRVIAMTTTNGTRALRATAPAQHSFVGSLLNLQSVAKALRQDPPPNLLLLGSGTHEETALEDVLAAGALCERLWDLYGDGQVADSAEIARQLYTFHCRDLPAAMRLARNGRRLLENPELRDDVAFALRVDALPLLATYHRDGAVRAGFGP